MSRRLGRFRLDVDCQAPKFAFVAMAMAMAKLAKLADVSDYQDRLSDAAIPTILVSNKCDNPPSYWKVGRERVEVVCNTYEGTESFQTSATAPETHKRCISVILRNIALKRSGKPLDPWDTFLVLILVIHLLILEEEQTLLCLFLYGSALNFADILTCTKRGSYCCSNNTATRSDKYTKSKR